MTKEPRAIPCQRDLLSRVCLNERISMRCQASLIPLPITPIPLPQAFPYVGCRHAGNVPEGAGRAPFILFAEGVKRQPTWNLCSARRELSFINDSKEKTMRNMHGLRNVYLKVL